jgi:hypothetical protein
LNDFDWGYVALSAIGFSPAAIGMYAQHVDGKRAAQPPAPAQPTKPEEFSWLLHGEDR